MDEDGTRPVYMDCCATTPLLPPVLEEIERYLTIEFGNEGSRTHAYGAAAKKRVNQARSEIATVVDANPDEVIFTSGATEANNLAILGLATALSEQGRRHVVTSALEHKAVLEPIARLGDSGFEATFLPANESGLIDVEQVLDSVRSETGLISLMHVNNETGTIQEIDRIAERLPEDIFLHVDAAQGFGKELDRLKNPRIDLISASAHKVHGPKGIGALIARRRGYARPPLEALMLGGGQERGLRPGTIPVHLAAGFGAAASAAIDDHDAREEANRRFRTQMMEALAPLSPAINGDYDATLTQVANVSFPGIDAEAAILATKDLVAVSSGSACASGSFERSHVLAAMGLDDERLDAAIRFSWCHLTPEPDWQEFVSRLGSLRG